MTQNANKPFVCYITEHLLKKVTQSDNLKLVTVLNLPFSKEKNEKIRFLENLHTSVNLQSLILSNHLISKIENLDKLTYLRELNLSDNRIIKIENLDKLINLEELDLSGNRIEKIPKSIAKNINIKILRLERNNISAIGDIANLQPIAGLTNLSLHPNPVSELPHYQEYTIYTLRTLHVLDGDSVSLDDRRNSIERFSRGSEEKLQRDISKLETEHKGIRYQLDEANDNLRKQRERNEVLEEEVQTLREENRRITEEANIKNIMLERKSAELSKVMSDMYTLQQELAFYKLDNPFTNPMRPAPVETKTLAVIPSNEKRISISSVASDEAIKSLNQTLTSLKVKFNHLVDKHEIGKTQQEQTLARLQTTFQKLVANEFEISENIRQFCFENQEGEESEIHHEKESDKTKRQQVALAESLRQSERLATMLDDLDSKVKDRKHKLSSLVKEQKILIEQDHADLAEKLESEVQDKADELQTWQDHLTNIEDEHNAVIRVARQLEHILSAKSGQPTDNDESSDYGEFEDEIAKLQTSLRGIEIRIAECASEAKNTDRTMEILGLQQSDLEKTIQNTDMECKRVEAEIKRMERVLESGEESDQSEQVEDLLLQLKEKSDEISTLQATVAKLEASHARHISSLKNLALVNLQTSASSPVPEGRRSVSPSRQKHGVLESSTRTLLFPQDSDSSHPSEDENTLKSPFRASSPALKQISQITLDPFMAVFPSKAIDLIEQLEKIDQSQSGPSITYKMRSDSLTASQVFDVLQHMVASVSSNWQNVSENLTGTLEEALQTITQLNTRIQELETQLIVRRESPTKPAFEQGEKDSHLALSGRIHIGSPLKGALDAFLVPTTDPDLNQSGIIVELEARTSAFESQNFELETRVSQLELELNNKSDHVIDLEGRNSELEELVAKFEELVSEMERKTSELAYELDEKCNIILKLESTISDLDALVSEKEDMIDELHEMVNKLEEKIREEPDSNSDHVHQIAELERKVAEMGLQNSEQFVNELQERVQFLEQELDKKAAETLNTSQGSPRLEVRYTVKIQELTTEMTQQQEKSQHIISDLTDKVKALELELSRKLEDISRLSSSSSPSTHTSDLDSSQVELLQTLVNFKDNRLKAEELLRQDYDALKKQVVSLTDVLDIQKKEIQLLHQELENSKAKATEVEKEKVHNAIAELTAANEMKLIQQKLAEYLYFDCITSKISTDL